MRLTRSRVANHADENEGADAPAPPTPVKERVPLGEVAGNIEQVAPETMVFGKKSKAKGGKKAKGKKEKAAEEEAEPTEPQQVLEDERLAAASPASDAAAEDLVKGASGDVVQIPMADERPASPPSRAARLTRRQLAKEEDFATSQNQYPAEHIIQAAAPKEAPPAKTPAKRTRSTRRKAVKEDEEEQNAPEDDEVPIDQADGHQDQLPGLQPPSTDQVDDNEVKEEALPAKTPAKTPARRTRGTHGKAAQKHEEEQVEPPTEELHEGKDELSVSHDPAVTEEAHEDPVNEEAPPAKTPAKRTRSLRRKPAKEEHDTQVQEAAPEKAAEDVAQETPIVPEPEVPTIDTPKELAQAVVQEEVVPDEPQPTVTEISPDVTITPDVAEPKCLTTPKASENKPFPSRSPSRSPNSSRTPMRLELSIGAIDALEDAIEEVGRAIPGLETLESGEQSPRKLPARTRATPKKSALAKAKMTKLSVPAPKVSRNPSALKSIKPVSNAANSSKARTSTAPRVSIARSVSVKEDKSKDAEERKPSSGVTDYLASKRRPVSVSFPTPPPPPKSSRPITKPTFQLPGEAIAAKLKAQKEERLKREAEKASKPTDEAPQPKAPTFKARPAPNFKAPASTVVRQTAASKARENLMNGTGERENKAAPGISIHPPPPPPKRTTSNPTGAKRPSTLAPNKRSSTLLSRSASIASATGSTDSLTTKPSSSFSSSARPAFTTSLSSDSAKRLSTLPGAKSTVTATDVATQRVKAREIFNRDRMERERLERERREKESAARRARIEAAERGRVASREWAERMKARKGGGGA